jgi:hypothetical protein
VKRRPQVPLPVVRNGCRRRHLATVRKAVSISRRELSLIGDPLRGRCHSRRQQLMRLNIQPACQSRLLPNRRHLRPTHGPAFTSGLGPALVVLNHRTGAPYLVHRTDVDRSAACLTQIVKSKSRSRILPIGHRSSALNGSCRGFDNQAHEDRSHQHAVITGHGHGRRAAGNSTCRFTPAAFFIRHAPVRGVPEFIPHRALSSGIPAWPCRLLRPRQAF